MVVINMRDGANIERADDNELDILADYLEKRSGEICADNGCTEDDHKCDSYAYVTEGGLLIDICIPTCFKGWGSKDEDRFGESVAVPLPFIGDGDDLVEAIEENL